MATALIGVPQEEEIEPLLEAWEELGHPSIPRRVERMELHAIPSLEVLAAVAGHGKAQFALQAQHLVDEVDGLRSLICAGAAGSLAEDVATGDLVVATETVEHDYELRFGKSDPPAFPAASRLVEEIRDATEGSGAAARIHFGRIASGDEDVVDPVRAAEVRDRTGALCVAWEGSGAARVARFNGLAFLEIRGITDSADVEAPASFRENLPRVMPRIAELLVGWRSG